MVRVLIVDGQSKVRRGLLMRLAIEPDIRVVGETGKAGEALYLAQALEPEVIVVDIDMGGGEGINLVQRLPSVVPASRLIVLTLHGDQDMRAQAREAGAHAFLEKCSGAAELVETIHQLAAWRSGQAVPGESRMLPAEIGAERDAECRI